MRKILFAASECVPFVKAVWRMCVVRCRKGLTKKSGMSGL